MKQKDSLDIDYSRNEGGLGNQFFPEKRSSDVSFGPYRETSVSKIPPPTKKSISFGLGIPIRDILRSSEMTDRRPCPQGWAYFRVPSCSTETCQAQTNRK